MKIRMMELKEPKKLFEYILKKPTGNGPKRQEIFNETSNCFMQPWCNSRNFWSMYIYIP